MVCFIGQDRRDFQMRFKSGVQISSQMDWKRLCGALDTPEGLFCTHTAIALYSIGKVGQFSVPGAKLRFC